MTNHNYNYHKPNDTCEHGILFKDCQRCTVLQRVQKLLVLAGNNPNEQEAQEAANRAHAMLAEFNLTLSDVEARGGKSEDNFITDDQLMTESVPWRRPLGTMVAKMFFCSYMFAYHKKWTSERACGYIRYDKHYFIGARHNVEVAKHMFQYLSDTIERLADEGAKTCVGNRSSFRTDFKSACAGRVCSRIQTRIDESKRGPTIVESSGNTLPALASLYDQTEKKLKLFIKEQHPGSKVSKSRGRASSYSEGAHAGRRAGDSIGLDQQVGRSQSKLLK